MRFVLLSTGDRQGDREREKSHESRERGDRVLHCASGYALDRLIKEGNQILSPSLLLLLDRTLQQETCEKRGEQEQATDRHTERAR